MSQDAMVAPNGFWIKTHIWQEGSLLKAKSYLVVAGEPVVFEVAVNLTLVEKALIAYHKRLHSLAQISGEAHELGPCIGCGPAPDYQISGLLGNLSKAVQKVGKSKLVKAVSNTAKKVVQTKVAQKAIAIAKPVAKAAKAVVKSKVTGALIATAAVAFPPVGVPAAAAYASANAALAAIEKGGAIRKAAVSTLNKIKATGQKPVLSTAVKAQLTSAVKAEQLAKTQIAKLAVAAKTASDPKKQVEAKKVLAVVSVAAKNRAQVKAIPVKTPAQTQAAVKVANQKTAVSNTAQQTAKAAVATAKAAPTPANTVAAKVAQEKALAAKVEAVKAQAEVVKPAARAQGLIVTDRGLIVRGVFNELPVGGTRGLLYRPEKSLAGNYQKIAGGCIGCGW